MLSDMLVAGLERYGIGPRIRALRLNKDLSLAQLGEHTGLSAGMLSKIERGQLFPTLPTLLRIALVFGVGLEHFFVEEERPAIAVVRKAERLRLPDRPGAERPSFLFESLDFPIADRKLEGYLAEFPADAAPSEAHAHGGAELVYVLRGRLAITVAGEDHELAAGDAMYFDSTAPHSYAARGGAGCEAIVVVAG